MHTSPFKPSSVYYPSLGKSAKAAEIAKKKLSADDLKVIKSYLSKHKMTLSFVRPANFRFNKEEEFNGAIALAVHFVVIFCRDPGNKTLFKRASFHIFDIQALRLQKKHKFLIFCRLEGKSDEPIINIRVISYHALKFAQNLRRNYLLSTCSLQGPFCDFRTKLPNEFPVFQNYLSPSQMYQMTYAAFCSRAGIEISQEVVAYYHTRLIERDGVFDFGQFHEIFSGRNGLTLLEPAIWAMLYVSYLHAIVCHNRPFPCLVSAIAPIVGVSSRLRFIHVAGSGISEGFEELGKQIISNPLIPLRYIDVSRNPNPKLGNLMMSLGVLKTDVFYINLSMCNQRTLKPLFDSLENPYLGKLKYLYFNGNNSDIECARLFREYLERIKKKCHLTSLGLGGNSEALVHMFDSVYETATPITELSLAGTSLDNPAAVALAQFMKKCKTVKTIDLSYSNTDPELIQYVLREMANDNSEGYNIKLNGLDLSGTRLMSIGKGFLYSNLEKWNSIELSSNSLTRFDLDFLLSILWRMGNLRVLDINNNFSDSPLGIKQTLKSIEMLKQLTTLRIGGVEGSGGLSDAILPLLTYLSKMTTLEELDISWNSIGEEGFAILDKLIQNNKNLETLMVDGSFFPSLDCIQKLVDRVCASENIIFFGFPESDCQRILKKVPKDQYGGQRLRAQALKTIATKAINNHRKLKGLPSTLGFKCVPELGYLVDEIHKDMEVLLKETNPRVHNGVCTDMNLPLPYQSRGQELSDGGEVSRFDIGDMTKYRGKHQNLRIIENVAELNVSSKVPEGKGLSLDHVPAPDFISEDSDVVVIPKTDKSESEPPAREASHASEKLSMGVFSTSDNEEEEKPAKKESIKGLEKPIQNKFLDKPPEFSNSEQAETESLTSQPIPVKLPVPDLSDDSSSLTIETPVVQQKTPLSLKPAHFVSDESDSLSLDKPPVFPKAVPKLSESDDSDSLSLEKPPNPPKSSSKIFDSEGSDSLSIEKVPLPKPAITPAKVEMSDDYDETLSDGEGLSAIFADSEELSQKASVKKKTIEDDNLFDDVETSEISEYSISLDQPIVKNKPSVNGIVIPQNPSKSPGTPLNVKKDSTKVNQSEVKGFDFQKKKGFFSSSESDDDLPKTPQKQNPNKFLFSSSSSEFSDDTDSD